MGIKFVPFNRRENRRSLAIFFAEEIAHLGALKNRAILQGSGKNRRPTAENRAILVHSAPLTVLVVGLCTNPLRKAKIIGLGRTQGIFG